MGRTWGKWLVYGSLNEIERLAKEMDRLVESREIVSAKFWNATNVSAMCVYSLAHESEKTRKIFLQLGYIPLAWEYDYNKRKNWTRPRFFLSALYKLRILIKTFGFVGAIKFIFRAYVK
jgi:hypothetical protein